MSSASQALVSTPVPEKIQRLVEEGPSARKLPVLPSVELMNDFVPFDPEMMIFRK